MATVCLHVIYEVEIPEIDELDPFEDDYSDRMDEIIADCKENWSEYIEGQFTAWCEDVEEV